MLAELLEAAVTFLVSYIVIYGRIRRKGLPPGPFRFPMETYPRSYDVALLTSFSTNTETFMAS